MGRMLTLLSAYLVASTIRASWEPSRNSRDGAGTRLGRTEGAAAGTPEPPHSPREWVSNPY
jgi:hypothetical protein